MRPEWLWALLPAAILAMLLWHLRNRSGSWSSVISPELLPYLVGADTGARRRNLVPGLLLLWLVATLAAAGPSWQKIAQPVHQKQDALVLVLDLSYSMTAGDLAPSRIDRARQKLLDLLDERREGQTGLIAYAGDAHIVTPLTDDTPTIANLLPALHPGIMPVPGSNPTGAIEQAIALMRSAGIRQGRILLVTDGISARDAEDISALLDGSGMQLAVMGIGTATGAPLPLPRGGFLKDAQGTIVMPTLAESELRQLANQSNGRYMRMQIDNSDLDYLLAGNLLTLPEQTLALDRSADTWEDQGYLLTLLLLMPALALFRRGWIVCLLPLLALPTTQPAHAGVWDDLWLTRDQQGQQALQRQDNEAAAQLFENRDWAGTAAYRNGDYESSVQSFSDGDSADSWYNRGNALARSGQLEDAMTAYNESLQRDPGHADAEENLALLEKMQQQQEQQSQDQQSEDDEQQDQDQDQQQDQQQGQGQQQPQDEQSQQDSQGEQPQGDSEQQSQGDEQQQQDAAASDDKQDSEGSEAQAEPEGEETQQEHEPLPPPDHASAGQAMQENAERDQAMEQWLRRVPDDPSGLLREKFRYESRQRQQNGKGKNDETYW